MRSEKRNTKMDVVDILCTMDSKMFHKYINGKVKKREGVNKVKVNEVSYYEEPCTGNV